MYPNTRATRGRRYADAPAPPYRRGARGVSARRSMGRWVGGACFLVFSRSCLVEVGAPVEGRNTDVLVGPRAVARRAAGRQADNSRFSIVGEPPYGFVVDGSSIEALNGGLEAHCHFTARSSRLTGDRPSQGSMVRG